MTKSVSGAQETIAPSFEAEAVARPFNPSSTNKAPPWLLSPWADVLMVGGLSVLIYAVLITFFENTAKNDMTAAVAAQLAFVVNNPHFMASYGMLYWDQRKRLTSNWRMINAAFLVPVVLIAYYAYAMVTASQAMFGWAVNAMYFFVGWHYVKQIYGVMMVAGVRKNYFYSDLEKNLLRWMMFPLWMVSYLNGNQSVTNQNFYGITYQTFYLPQWAVKLNLAFVALASMGFAAIFIHKWVKTGKVIDLVSLAALVSIYVWHMPGAYHGLMWYLIPLFHSLQYLLFVTTYKHHEMAAHAVQYSAGKERQRFYYATRVGAYVAMMIATAYLSFEGIPRGLDKVIPYNHAVLGTSLFLFMFTNFINIHHYFIDSAIWRRDNDKMAKYLVKPSPVNLSGTA